MGINNDAFVAPTEWHVFGPVPRTHVPLSTDALARVPTELSIEGQTLYPHVLSVNEARLDMSPYIGGTANGHSGYVYIPFEIQVDNTVLFGLGADYWFEAWIDGQALMDNLETGSKFPPPPTSLDYRKRIHLAKGRHVLAIRFISGTGTSLLCASVLIRTPRAELFPAQVLAATPPANPASDRPVLPGAPLPPRTSGDRAQYEALTSVGGCDIFRWTDVCNVYVLRSGAAALLIDLGDGSVLEHLTEIGVTRLDGVLFTHHHREQCQGGRALQHRNVPVAVPEKERLLFSDPSLVVTRDRYAYNPYTISRTGAIYVRPPIDPLSVQHGLIDEDTFIWRGQEFLCVETAGNSPGGMSYLLRTEHGWIAFTGDVILAGGTMHTWFDSDWSYGGGEGLNVLLAAVSRLETIDPPLVQVLPSHGPAITAPVADLRAYGNKLQHLKQILHSPHGGPDEVSQPTLVPDVLRVTPHLYKLKSGGNFTLLLADSGRALIFDCGATRDLPSTLDHMAKGLGLKTIDAILISHMHGDHIGDAPTIRKKWGAPIWTLDRIADKFEEPHRFNYLCAVADPIHMDRTFRSGETFAWEGYALTVDWMPGQTEFGCCVHGMIDNRLVAFTGDNIFGPDRPGYYGHPSGNSRCGMIFEEGYILGADYLRRLQPDLLMCGHSQVIEHPRELIERYYQRSVEWRDAVIRLSAEPDYRYMFDPFWVRADPYRIAIQPGNTAEVAIYVRNFLDHPQVYRLNIHCPEGIRSDPTCLSGTVPAAGIVRAVVQLTVSADMIGGAWAVALDVTLDERRYGEWFEMVVVV